MSVKIWMVAAMISLSLLACSAVDQRFIAGLEAFEKDDFSTARENWMALANEGNSEAQNNLGWLYANGLGVPQDYRLAEKWYTLSAKQ